MTFFLLHHGVVMSMRGKGSCELQEGLCQHVVSFKFPDECCAVNL